MWTLKSIKTPAKPRAAMSDDALIAAVAQGDVTAFEQVHKKYFPKLMHFARRITGSAEAAEEVANDVLMTVWRTADRFEGRSKPSTWIFGIAYRVAMKQRTKLQRRAGDVELDEGMIASKDDTAEAVIRGTDLKNALDQLKPELRAVVELTYYNGYLYTEIAEILDCPVGTVKTRMMTARRRLRGILSDEEQTGGEHAVA
ncbi:RNA polymerase sigma factor [uncultured Tateyamaria sp.]|uniref:RNA polymerase sigma factor n=2 Tax=uncultured Tateyamaria sp. TaxID=455651 RepID=UPI002634EB2C|nr:RNA polymerase sigma factor [uncultured Tateyamaria sp.]